MATDSAKVSRKNVTLISSDSDGITSYKLLDSQGVVSAFTAYASTLTDHPFNTRKTYCHAVADFFDYFYEASIQLATLEEGKAELTRAELRRIIEFWHDYLTEGDDSGKELVRHICKTLPSPRVSKSTAAVKNAALARFLELSNDLREENNELVSLKLIASPVQIDPEPLLESFKKLIKTGSLQRLAMISNSMLGGVIAGGPQHKKKKQRQVKAITNSFDMSRVFPFDKICPLIDCLQNYRDQALYSLYAASGCRSHEGLQILWSDIDVDARTIRLIDPNSRWNDQSYRSLTAKDRDRIAWKGRETNLAFLIEPFASLFFDTLEKYVREEYYPHGQHQFVFQTLKGKQRGRPYFLTAQQTRQQVFNTAAVKIGLPSNVEGVHSLRHAYATYLLNYIQVAPGIYGLPIGTVRVMLGHANVKSTEKYAVRDSELIKAQLGYANEKVFRGGLAKTFEEMKMEVLRSALSAYEKNIEDAKSYHKIGQKSGYD